MFLFESIIYNIHNPTFHKSVKKFEFSNTGFFSFSLDFYGELATQKNRFLFFTFTGIAELRAVQDQRESITKLKTNFAQRFYLHLDKFISQHVSSTLFFILLTCSHKSGNFKEIVCNIFYFCLLYQISSNLLGV